MHNEIYNELLEYACNVAVVSTHSHHNYHDNFIGFSLKKLIDTSYPGWGAGPFADNAAGWKNYFVKTACRSDAYWLHRAIGEIYLDGTILNYENYIEADRRIREKCAEDPYYHEKIITDICHIETLILDEHRDPGDDHGLAFVRPAMRLDWALTADEQALKLLGGMPDTFEEYVETVDDFIAERVKRYRVVTFKLACAYSRPLDFRKVTREEAAHSYVTDRGRQLGDYMMVHACELAQHYGLPFQIHTGTGQLDRTSAMNLMDMIKWYPDVSFVLLHCSFPWMEDALALARTLNNVYLDLSWVFTLSTSMGNRLLREALDFVNLDRIAWGCDTWTAEEGYGALLAVREALANEFARRIDEGLMDIPAAKKATDMLLRENALKLYRL